MDNFSITENVIFEKLLRNIKQFGKEETVTVSDICEEDCNNTDNSIIENSEIQLFLDEAYIHLNEQVRSSQISSMKRLTTKQKGIFARIALIGKYIIRKLTFWYVHPICVDQTVFNEATTQFNVKLLEYLKAGQHQEQVKNEISSLENRISDIELQYHRQEEEYSQKEEEYRQREEEYFQKEKEYRQREEEYSQKEEEYRQKEEEYHQKEEEYHQREKEYHLKTEEYCRQKEEEYRQQQEKYWQREEKYHAQIEEYWQKEEAYRQRELEFINKEATFVEYMQKYTEMDELIQFLSKETQRIGESISSTNHHLDLAFGKEKDLFWEKTTYAQSGEDAILEYIFYVLGIDVTNARYIDLGANHAKELSNTYGLYRRGMRGVLVEANPKLIPELKFYRNEDIILNKCIAEDSGKTLTFYIMNGDGLSSTDLNSVNEAMKKNPALHIEDTIDVTSISANDILEQYFEEPPTLLNIDIEGMEEHILDSLNYEKYAPLIIIVERIDYDTTIALNKRQDNIQMILESHGYIEYAFTGINSIFINTKRLGEMKK